MEKDNVYGWEQDFEINFDEVQYEMQNELEAAEVPVTLCSAQEALILSIERFQKIDFEYMMGLTGLSFEQLIQELGGKYIWQNPREFALTEEERDGWQLPQEYFVGNPFVLLEEAIEMHEHYGRFAANIAELQSRIEKIEKKSIDNVRFAPGNPVLTGEIHARYIKEKKGLDFIPKIVNIGHKWIVYKPDRGRKGYRSEFETEFMDLYSMMGHLMNDTLHEAIVNQKGNEKEKITLKEKNERILIVQEKATLLQEDFDNWIHNTEDIRQEVEERYFKRYTFIQPEYDVSLLKLKDLNPNIELYYHQKIGVLRILLAQNLLLNHSTGAGKTLTMVVAAHMAYQLGLSSKTMIVAPRESFDEFVDTSKYAYPNDKILAIRPGKDFTKAKQRQTLRRIRDNDYTAIIIPDSSFDEISMSNDFKIKQKEKEIRACRRELSAYESSDRLEAGAIKRKITTLEKQLKKMKEKLTESATACFESLGITMLMVDECHNYKNITLDSRLNAVGGRSKGSDKSDSMIEKVHYVQSQKGKVVFATGTPLSNSLSDLYTMQKYLQEKELEFCGISKFSMWANSFAQSETTFDLDLMLNPRFVTRFTSFYNLTELRGLFGKVCDTYYAEKDVLNLPEFQGYTNIVVQKSEEQKEYDQEILDRLEKIRLKLVDRTQDNFLLITMDARNASTDIRLVREGMDDEITYSKASVCAEKMVEIYQKHPGTTQIAFCDCSTPKSTFNVYDEIRKQLELRGIPEEEIAYIHDGSTAAKRKKLLEEFNAGKIRIMIGSTKKLGTGVNVQENLIAVHHVDVPWRPADFTQREGRIIRQGNKNEKVFIYRYITENSFDAYMWQLIESKQKFIDCFLIGELDPGQYDVNDISDIILSYAEAKALAIGNPLIKERVETANEIGKLRVLQRKRRRELEEWKNIMSDYPEKIEKLDLLIRQVEEDMKHYKKHKESLGQEEREYFGADLFDELRRNIMQTKERLFDRYQGFDVMLPKFMTLDKPYIILKRKNGGSYYIKMDGDKVLGCSARIDYLLNHLPKRRQQQLEEKDRLEREYRKSVDEVLKGNVYDDLLLKAIETLNSIDRALEMDGQ